MDLESKSPEHLMESYQHRLSKWAKINSLPQPNKVDAVFGSFWMTSLEYQLPNGDRKQAQECTLVVIMGEVADKNSSLPSVEVAVVSDEVYWSMDEDFILDGGICPFGSHPHMIEFWNSYKIPAKNLGKYLGVIENEEILDQLKNAWLWKKEFDEDIEPGRVKVYMEESKNYPLGKIPDTHRYLNYHLEALKKVSHLQEQNSALDVLYNN